MSKICIVEDEPSILEMYRMRFQADGHEVFSAGDGAEGLKVIRESLPDLVLLDLMMPIMDGYQVLTELRADPAIAKTKVYICSNLGQTSEIEQGMAKGADGYFVKSSLTPTELVKEVERVLKVAKVE